jgi:transposase
MVVDTLGLLLLVSVTTAGVQDRTAAHRALEQVRFVMASVLTVFADGGYAASSSASPGDGCACRWTSSTSHLSRSGFSVLPRRWVVERTFGWLMRCRRLSPRSWPT